mmetsp:Transcript_46226/g.100478  ORF Transcript_46226/g.100478 Transcript_46226/m.100478 type:complete len:210 (+) Transcript_46226:245-874(+)
MMPLLLSRTFTALASFAALRQLARTLVRWYRWDTTPAAATSAGMSKVSRLSRLSSTSASLEMVVARSTTAASPTAQSVTVSTTSGASRSTNSLRARCHTSGCLGQNWHRPSPVEKKMTLGANASSKTRVWILHSVTAPSSSSVKCISSEGPEGYRSVMLARSLKICKQLSKGATGNLKCSSCSGEPVKRYAAKAESIIQPSTAASLPML